MPDIKLKELLENGGMMFMLEKEKGVHEEDEVIVPQIGRMSYKNLKKNVEGKAKDLYARIKRGDFKSIGDNMLEIFSHFVRVARAYSEGSKVPQGTMFKESFDKGQTNFNEIMIKRDFWKIDEATDYVVLKPKELGEGVPIRVKIDDEGYLLIKDKDGKLIFIHPSQITQLKKFLAKVK